MNIWNKQDVEKVIEGLQTSKLVKVNGQIFVRSCIEDDANDETELSINFMTHQAGGAGVLRMDAEQLLLKHVDNPGSIASHLLRASDMISGQFMCVSIINGAFKEKYAPALRFLIAHEIGHIVHGHTDGMKIMSGWEDMNEEHEFIADAFAVELLGDNEGALMTLGHLLDAVLKAEDSENKEAAKEHIMRRLERVY